MNLFKRFKDRRALEEQPAPARPVPKPGQVLIETAGSPSSKAGDCVAKHTGCLYSQADMLLRLLPQVIEVDDTDAFCADMRALDAVVLPRDAWRGTAEAWAEIERRRPPRRLGRYDVHGGSYPCVILFACPLGGVKFNLETCEASIDYGTDRMNAGGFTHSFRRQGQVTVGDVLTYEADLMKDWYGYEPTPGELADDTVLWPVRPWAGDGA